MNSPRLFLVKDLKKGFTLVELLVVIAIVAVLAVVVLLTVNPVELFRQSRDSNRVADMNTVRKAVALYMADVKTVTLGTPNDFGGGAANSWCFATTSTGQVAGAGCGAVFGASYNVSSTHASSTLVRQTNGTGWVPIDFTQMSTKPPFTVLPIDPTNNASYYYAYAATSTNGGVFELTAILESTKYMPLATKDGGASSTVYEVGTILNL